MQNVVATQAQRDPRVVTPSAAPPFQQVPIEAIGASWGFVERGLNQILARCGKDDWTPADIRRHLRQGRASLFVRKDGFVVLEVAHNPITAEPYLNVWLMWFEAQRLPRDGVATWLKNLARSLNLERVQFASPREGWGDYLGGIFRPAYTVWRMDV